MEETSISFVTYERQELTFVTPPKKKKEKKTGNVGYICTQKKKFAQFPLSLHFFFIHQIPIHLYIFFFIAVVSSNTPCIIIRIRVERNDKKYYKKKPLCIKIVVAYFSSIVYVCIVVCIFLFLFARVLTGLLN